MKQDRYLLQVFLSPKTFLQSVLLDMSDDETIKLQRCPLLDGFVEAEPGEEAPQQGPPSPGVEPPECCRVNVDDPRQSHELRARLQPGVSQS